MNNNNYTYSEQVDMLLVYGFCQGNGRESVRVYRERFPNRRVPNHQTFANIERRLREHGRFEPRNADRGRERTTRIAEVEEEILDRIEGNPKLSVRPLGLELAVPKSTVHEVIREQLLHPYHVQTVQELLPIDPERRLDFCHFIQNQRNQDPNFHRKILFTDEASFRRSGMTNLHNEHVYSDQNPHATKVAHHQHEFAINIWAGVIDNFIIGPVVIPNRLNGENYLQFLQQTVPELLEDLPLLLRQNMWFMHDGAPPHFTLAVRRHLHQQYPNRWIGRGDDAPRNWPARSPDLTPCDYFLWGALKTEVYLTPVNTGEELQRRIVNAANILKNNQEMMQRVQFNLLRRINICIHQNGGHFEHLL